MFPVKSVDVNRFLPTAAAHDLETAMTESTSTSTTVLWRGRSAADRARERRERLLVADMGSLGTVGGSQTTLRAVCRDAGVGLRYFYESFTDLNELLLAVYDRVADELITVVINRIADAAATPQTRAHAAFGAAVDFIDDDQRRGRILFRETLTSDVLREHGAATVPKFVLLVTTALAGQPQPADGAGTSRGSLRISALSGALVALFLDWQSGALIASKQELVDYCSELTRTVLGDQLIS